MSGFNTLAYRIKHSVPGLFSLLERLARGLTAIRYGQRLGRARLAARLAGTLDGNPAAIRALLPSDRQALGDMLHRLPPAQLKFFRPHGFDAAGLTAVLSSRAFLPYGLFIGDELVAYALLKITPTGSAFAGSMVHPSWQGRGIGKFLSRYMYWQAALAGLTCYATISKDNIASLKAYQSGRDYRVVSELPNDYFLIEFPRMAVDNEVPTLAL